MDGHAPPFAWPDAKIKMSFKALFWSIDQIRSYLIFWWSKHLLLGFFQICWLQVAQLPSRSLGLSEPAASKYGKKPKTHGMDNKNIWFCVSPWNATCTEHTDDRGQLEALKCITGLFCSSRSGVICPFVPPPQAHQSLESSSSVNPEVN